MIYFSWCKIQEKEILDLCLNLFISTLFWPSLQLYTDKKKQCQQKWDTYSCEANMVWLYFYKLSVINQYTWTTLTRNKDFILVAKLDTYLLRERLRAFKVFHTIQFHVWERHSLQINLGQLETRFSRVCFLKAGYLSIHKVKTSCCCSCICSIGWKNTNPHLWSIT